MRGGGMTVIATGNLKWLRATALRDAKQLPTIVSSQMEFHYASRLRELNKTLLA